MHKMGEDALKRTQNRVKQILPHMTLEQIEEECRQENLAIFNSMQLQREYNEDLEENF